jgi:hypothetical protein
MRRFAVILAHNRPELLCETWCAIGPQVDMVLVIDNASTPPVDADPLHADGWATAVLRIPDQPPNIARMWNVGIARVIDVHEAQAGDAKGRPFIAVLCDDAPPPPGWFDAVTQAMVETGAVVGASAPAMFSFAGAPRMKRERDSDLAGRMPGWAWILDPVSPVRPDERFEYWWGDTDLDVQARGAGGMVLIGSHPVPNLVPDGWTGHMAAQVAVDSQRFVDKYDGWRPW